MHGADISHHGGIFVGEKRTGPPFIGPRPTLALHGVLDGVVQHLEQLGGFADGQRLRGASLAGCSCLAGCLDGAGCLVDEVGVGHDGSGCWY